MRRLCESGDDARGEKNVSAHSPSRMGVVEPGDTQGAQPRIGHSWWQSRAHGLWCTCTTPPPTVHLLAHARASTRYPTSTPPPTVHLLAQARI